MPALIYDLLLGGLPAAGGWFLTGPAEYFGDLVDIGGRWHIYLECVANLRAESAAA
jgi:hypothetical protein